MRILLFQDLDDIREKVVFFLESSYGATVFEAPTVDDAIRIIQETNNPKIQLIIFDNKKVSPSKIVKFFSASTGIPLLMCTEGKPLNAPGVGTVVGTIDRANFIESVSKILDDFIKKGILIKEDVPQDFCRIKTKLLLSVYPLKGDLYIRLSNNKFVKVFNKGDTFESSDLEKYTIKKGIDYLYIRKADCQEFAQKYKEELKKLLSAKDISLDEAGQLGELVFDTVRELHKQLGFTKEVQDLAKTQVRLTLRALGRDPDLQEIMDKIKKSKGVYLAAHSILCAHLSCALAAHLEWGSETTFHKLTMASFFHDIVIDNSEVAMIDSIDELEQVKFKFTPEEIKTFREHPILAADMVTKMTDIPPDVDTIIRQHHERPNGTGFPRGLTYSYISPLSSVFIIAHDLTRHALIEKENFKVPVFIDKVRDKYKSSQFKKILSCLEEMEGL